MAYRPAGRAGLTDRPIRSDPCRELDLDSGTRSPPGAHGPCNDDDDPCAFRVRRSGEFSTCALDRASYAGFRWKSWRPRGFSSQDGWMHGWGCRERPASRRSRPTPASTELNRHGIWVRPSVHPDSTEAEPASSSRGRALRARCARGRSQRAAGAQAQPHGMPTGPGRAGTNSSPARIRAPPAADLHVRGPSVSCVAS